MDDLLYLCNEAVYSAELQKAQEEAVRSSSQFMLVWVVGSTGYRTTKRDVQADSHMDTQEDIGEQTQGHAQTHTLPDELCHKYVITIFKAHTKPGTSNVWMDPESSAAPSQDDTRWDAGAGAPLVGLEQSKHVNRWKKKVPKRWRMWDGTEWKGVSSIGNSWTWRGQPVRLDTQRDWRKFWRVFQPVFKKPVPEDWYFQDPHRDFIFSSDRKHYTDARYYQYTLDTFMARVQDGPEAVGHGVTRMVRTPPRTYSKTGQEEHVVKSHGRRKRRDSPVSSHFNTHQFDDTLLIYPGQRR
jgi:hypothetical protein